MKSFWVAVVVGLGLAGNAGASRYEIPLPELKGVYSTGDWGPYELEIPVELPAALSHIETIRVAVKGTVAPALWRGYSLVSDPYEPYEYEYYPSISFTLHPSGTYTPGAVADVREDGAFDVELAFLPFMGSNLDVLLGRRLGLYFHVDSPVIMGTEVQWQEVPAIVGIADARLVVQDTPVPEPGAGLVLLPAVLLLGRRRRKAV